MQTYEYRVLPAPTRGEKLKGAKTTEERYPLLESLIRSAHPYETPEIVAIPIVAGSPEYLAWIAAETQTERWPSP